MFRLRWENCNVAWIVVEFVSVDVMNNFADVKRSADKLLRDLPMQMSAKVLSISFPFSASRARHTAADAGIENTASAVHGILSSVVNRNAIRVPCIRVISTAEHVITNLAFVPQKWFPAPLAFDRDLQVYPPPFPTRTTGKRTQKHVVGGRRDALLWAYVVACFSYSLSEGVTIEMFLLFDTSIPENGRWS